MLQQKNEIQNLEDTSPDLPHDDTPNLYPVYLGGVFVRFDTLEGTELNSENESAHE